MTIKHIIDTTGRRGLITEDRGTGFFARPESMGAAVGFASGKLITATFWTRMPDGSLRGLWVDSKHGDFVTANLA